jgi:hypothetical protein
MLYLLELDPEYDLIDITERGIIVATTEITRE